MRKFVAVILIIALIAGAALLVKKRKNSVSQAPRPTPPSVTVKTVSAQTKSITATRTFLARLQAATSATITAKASGSITNLFTRESMQVEKGAPLMKVDDRELAATIDSLTVTLSAQREEADFSRSQHERNKTLFAAGGISREQLEASEVILAGKISALAATGAKIKALEAQQSYHTVTAPFAGTVGTIHLREGDLAAPGRPLITLHSAARKLTFSFPPTGQEIAVGREVLLNGKKIGQIVNLYAEAENGLVVAEVELLAMPDQPVDSYLTIEVVTASETGCALPLNALVHQNDTVVVMAYRDNRFAPFPLSVVLKNSADALVDPCPDTPVAIGQATRLSMLPSLADVIVTPGKEHE